MVTAAIVGRQATAAAVAAIAEVRTAHRVEEAVIPPVEAAAIPVAEVTTRN